ncbi:hypothetical protein LTR85_001372 [Meristemomyces frigidus]|nr:hypothetical protein LTR85_001372 [Meristemomyces frigidus]
METHFDVTEWQPTKAPEPGEEDISSELPTLIATLNDQTRAIYRHPYDPNGWSCRAETLARLRYPELAVGDTCKAIILCRTLLARLCEDRRYKLGYHMDFWMLDETESNDEEEDARRDDLEQRLVDLQADAHLLQNENLYHFPTFEEGRFLQRPYPWMEAKHRRRDDELLAEINDDFEEAELKIVNNFPKERPAGQVSKGRCCILKRHAFGEMDVGGNDSSELLGVFAARDLAQETVIVIDETEAWGCIGPGKGGSTSNLSGGAGCSDPIHPNLPSDDVSQDLRWIRERAGRYAAEVILRCRFLIGCIADDVAHPLDHTLIARLTPTYRREKVRLFGLEHDIAIPNDCLQQFGIDIFSDSSYDTWVLFTLEARVENNSWSDPLHSCISPLFSLFNHSCEPNVEKIHTIMVIRVTEDIKQGEQLFVDYDGFMKDQPLAARRKRMKKWLDADCQCTKCQRQEAEQQATDERCTCGCGGCKEPGIGLAEWDVADKPVFPEDAWTVRK